MRPAKITALILFILIISLGICEQIYIGNTFKKFDGYTDFFEKSIEANDFVAAENKMTEFTQWWEKRSAVLESLAHNRDIKTVTQEIAQLKAYIIIRNAPDAAVSVITLKSMTESLRRLLSFRFEHIV
ncbi:MAG: DUF4363 family protein [Clostridiales bacterium]|jgi:hypothetical protein|nr:DUF4363 family protein [Clostridiales bacterium]